MKKETRPKTRDALHPCLCCGHVKPLSEFYRSSENIGKHLKDKCLQCHNDDRRRLYRSRVEKGETEAKVAPFNVRVAILTKHGYSKLEAEKIVEEGLGPEDPDEVEDELFDTFHEKDLATL